MDNTESKVLKSRTGSQTRMNQYAFSAKQNLETVHTQFGIVEPRIICLHAKPAVQDMFATLPKLTWNPRKGLVLVVPRLHPVTPKPGRVGVLNNHDLFGVLIIVHSKLHIPESPTLSQSLVNTSTPRIPKTTKATFKPPEKGHRGVQVLFCGRVNPCKP